MNLCAKAFDDGNRCYGFVVLVRSFDSQRPLDPIHDEPLAQQGVIRGHSGHFPGASWRRKSLTGSFRKGIVLTPQNVPVSSLFVPGKVAVLGELGPFFPLCDNCGSDLGVCACEIAGPTNSDIMGS